MTNTERCCYSKLKELSQILRRESGKEGVPAMWNYSFIMPSALILLILGIYYVRRPRLPIRMNRVFQVLLTVDALTLLSDYLSTRVDELYLDYSVATGYAMNLLFFVFYLARIYAFFLFIVEILSNHSRLPRWVHGGTPLVFLACELVALSSPVTHALFSFDAAGYHRGDLYATLYFCFYFYLIAAASLLCVCWRELPRAVRFGLTGVVALLTVGNIIRMLMPTLLIMNTFCLMAILVIYLSFENPDRFLSDRGNAFNTKGFELLLTEWGQHRRFSLLSFIIRNYSETRSIYGGIQMDKCIVLINRYLAETFPDCVIFYLRNGSFAVLGPDGLDTRGMCEKIFARFQQPWETDQTELLLKPAFIEVDMENNTTSADRVISTILLALENAAQTEYGDRVMPISIHAIDRYLTEKRALDRALEADGLEVYLQPLIDSATGRLVAAEALARIRDADGRIIPPGDFIPIAEKDGSIIRLGEQVMRKTCAFIRDHDIRGLGLRWINVNLSPYQCMNRDLAQRFGEILREYRVPAEMIHLELTEQSILDYSLLKNQILALEELGFQFSLDDYGSGYSNLTRVKQYPFKNIKMDMEVVWNHFRDRDPLLPTLIQVFKQMNFSITAEGIESKEMAELMTAIGCDYLQGYFFSKPIPVTAFLERYRESA